MADILDYHLQHYLRRFIRRLPEDQQKELKSLYLCGQSLINIRSAVYLMVSDKGNARFYGHTTCKNPFSCPVCSARVMEQYRAKIATAIEMLHGDYFGFMATFAIPHLNFMSCRETMDILRETWVYCRMKFSRKHGHTFADWKDAAQLAHSVKVMEHTWGRKSSWHPHYHVIFWVPRGKEQEAGKWEEKLNEFWLKTAKRKTLQYWKKHNLHSFLFQREGDAEALLDRLYRKDKWWHKGVYFSRDKEGNLKEVESGDYICGWGADNELTGNVRKEASHKKHLTPYQILNLAKSDSAMEKLYIEYCLAVRKVHRVDFSQTGLVKMIAAYQKEHGKISERLQKKRSEETPTRWHIVAYFDKLQWYELCCLNRDAPVFSNMLYLAKNYVYLLGDYLNSLNMYPERVPVDYQEICEMFKCG